MSSAYPTLSEASIERVRSGWATKMNISLDAFSHKGRVLVPREGFSSVIALQLQQLIIVICPSMLEPLLSPLSGTELLDMFTLVHVLKFYSPAPLGTATISYAESNTLRNRSEVGMAAHPALPKEIIDVMSSCTRDEQDESGLEQMPFRFAVQPSNGKATALAGYEVWNGDIAQLGVLTAPQSRGQGFGFAAAAATATAAINANLIPQWRSRIDNEPSRQLGRQLGFVELGRQLALEVKVMPVGGHGV